MADAQMYKEMLTEFIKKQMVILGPNVALGTAKKVAGLQVSDDGSVVEISGDQGLMLKAVKNAYINLAGEISQITFQKVLEKYPEINKTG